MYQLTGGQLPQYKRMYEDAIESAKQYLMRSVEVPGWNNITIIGEMNSAVSFDPYSNTGLALNLYPGFLQPGLKRWNPFLDHLVCFAGGMLGLASRLLDRQNDIELALNVRPYLHFRFGSAFDSDNLDWQVTNSCTWLYEIFKSGVGSETIRLFEGDNPNAYKVVSAVISTLPNVSLASFSSLLGKDVYLLADATLRWNTRTRNHTSGDPSYGTSS